ncbi:DnaJsubfamily C member 3 [Hordeum vulgare]|nr:DnaJsubfamily C member 3 [Hordeum vulgare]
MRDAERSRYRRRASAAFPVPLLLLALALLAGGASGQPQRPVPPELRAVEAQLTALTNDVAQTISDRFSFCFSDTIDNASAIDSFTNLVLASLVFGSCEQINCGLMASFLLTLTQDMAIREALMKAERQLKVSKRKDQYKILGISKTASATDIKHAYKRLVLQWHPDKNVENHEEAENMFREIAAAYEVLSDEDKRVMYDRGEDLDEVGMGGGGGGFDPFGGGGGQQYTFHHGEGSPEADSRVASSSTSNGLLRNNAVPVEDSVVVASSMVLTQPEVEGKEDLQQTSSDDNSAADEVVEVASHKAPPDTRGKEVMAETSSSAVKANALEVAELNRKLQISDAELDRINVQLNERQVQDQELEKLRAKVE